MYGVNGSASQSYYVDQCSPYFAQYVNLPMHMWLFIFPNNEGSLGTWLPKKVAACVSAYLHQ